TTLVKCIMGEIPFTGSLKIGHNVKIGYFAQNQAQMLDQTLSVYETIDHVAVGDIRLKIRDLLGAFMFGEGDVDKKVSVLSGGEKTRLAMLRLLLEPMNLLILDEPTNHLDMRTKDILKEAIKAFEGTVIVVSHDREFLDGLVEKVYEFGGGCVKENLGGIYDFLRSKRMAELSELERRPVEAVSPAKEVEKAPPAPETKAAPASAPQRKLSYAEQKEREKTLRKAEKNVKAAEQEIARLEEEIAAMESEIATGKCDQEYLAAYADAQKRLENQMSVWELASMELDELRAD
ncbi:MAG: ATP-binding cassette domain-containing protein, partial [Muribaculaceae bacterium]|nr:ATP-binding cassette domain-containing protein [Muribaculaceae bacterium]